MPQSTLKVNSEVSRSVMLGTYTNLQTDDGDTTTVQTLSTSGGYLRCGLDDLPTNAVIVDQMQCEGKSKTNSGLPSVRQGFYYSSTFDYEEYPNITETSHTVRQNAWDTLNPIGGGWTVAIVNATAIEIYKSDSDGDAWYTYLWAYCDWEEGGSAFFWEWWAPILFGLETLGHCLKMENAERLMQYLQRTIRSAGCLHVPIACDYRRLMEQLPIVTR